MEPSRKRQRCFRSIPFPPSLNAWSCAKLDDSSIYPTVLLHLGFVLSQREKETGLLALLCLYWSRIVRTQIFDLETELELATQVLLKSDDDKAVRLILNTLSVLLSSCNQYDDNKANQLKDSCGKLASALIHHVDREEGVLTILKKLEKLSPTGKEFYTAACVIWNQTEDRIMDRALFLYGNAIQSEFKHTTSVLPLDYKDISCQLSFIWALSHSRKMSRILSETPTIMEFLLEHKQSRTFSTIAKKIRPTSKLACYLQELFVRISWNEKDGKLSSDSKKHELEALFHCVKHLEPSPEFLDKVEEIACNEEIYLATVAAGILCDLFDRGMASLLQRLLHILERSNVTEVLEGVTGAVSLNREVYTSQLVSIVANVSRRDSATLYLQERAIAIFHYYVEQNPSSWVGMARDSNFVKVVIKVLASDPRHSMHDKALEILWKISTPVANRRVLAHHTGLLPCLVRVLRQMPEERREGYVIRAKWKERVLNLADLL
mmetsp:Transcript_11144/g.17097  ORF Transcript_11144/g.17097 Transcript_11144/m.17097 type:complete len:492 (-) Transcript_11144:191-1666(-)